MTHLHQEEMRLNPAQGLRWKLIEKRVMAVRHECALKLSRRGAERRARRPTPVNKYDQRRRIAIEVPLKTNLSVRTTVERPNDLFGTASCVR
jgi:hypothetical protein